MQLAVGAMSQILMQFGGHVEYVDTASQFLIGASLARVSHFVVS